VLKLNFIIGGQKKEDTMKVKNSIILVLIGALFFAVPALARLCGNSSESAFTGGDTSSTERASLATCLSMGELVIKGAEYFFRAQADINLLSEKVEISDLNGVDFYSLWCTVNNALGNMNMARYYYQMLIDKAKNTPYNVTVINKLLVFNYDTFQEDNAMIKDIFSEVKGYLQAGDVRGVYSHTAAHLDNLIEILETIRGKVYWWLVPTNAHMWELNQTCAKTHMFGQYVSRIFYAIK
jgi:hypothetical protein